MTMSTREGSRSDATTCSGVEPGSSPMSAGGTSQKTILSTPGHHHIPSSSSMTLDTENDLVLITAASGKQASALLPLASMAKGNAFACNAGPMPLLLDFENSTQMLKSSKAASRTHVL